MSDKKIFIALSQREARSVLKATNFLVLGCSLKVGGKLVFNQKDAELMRITEDAVNELQNFADRLEQLANEQAELEASIDNPRLTDEVARLNGSYGQGQEESSIQNPRLTDAFGQEESSIQP